MKQKTSKKIKKQQQQKNGLNQFMQDAEDPAYKVPLTTNKKDPLLFLAFKLEESQFGQLTW